VLLTKMDLLPVIDDFDPMRARKAVRDLANTAPVIELSARKAINLKPWDVWLRSETARIRCGEAPAPGLHEAHHGHHPAAVA
jgi:hydrogenase nickel incorporation protein HypB